MFQMNIEQISLTIKQRYETCPRWNEMKMKTTLKYYILSLHFKSSNHHSYYASEAKRGLFDIIKIVKSSNQRRLSKEFDFLIILWLLPFWGFLRWHWAKAQPLLRPRPFPEKLK